MKTDFSTELLNTQQGAQANEILRNCVHCGFCLSVCPTYQLLGDELDSPRGRIYLIKSLLEGGDAKAALTHLDRCLTCASCQTSCPSGVNYTRLLDIGRESANAHRSAVSKGVRYLLRTLIITPVLFNTLVKLLPFLKHKPLTKTAQLDNHTAATFPQKTYKGKVVLLSGCVQNALAATINHSAKYVLNQLGYEVIETPQQQCCGAIDQHLSFTDYAKTAMVRNIECWSNHLSQGAEAIISTASGCGAMVKQYDELLAGHIVHTQAKLISEKTVDIGEFLHQCDLSEFSSNTLENIAFHAPCTLAHSQQKAVVVEQLLTKLGYHLLPVADAHLCCGSAGTYSLLQPKIAKALRGDKLKHLSAHQPHYIATANIGCLTHLQKGTKIPVHHWIELLAANHVRRSHLR